jgi:hypothetical protein
MTALLAGLTDQSMWRAVLFVAADGGPPKGWPFMMRALGGGLWCTSYRAGAKMRWIAAADEACCLLFTDEGAPEPYAVVDGVVKVKEPTIELIEQWLGSPYRPGEARVADRLASLQRVFITVEPTRPPVVHGIWPEPAAS